VIQEKEFVFGLVHSTLQKKLLELMTKKLEKSVAKKLRLIFLTKMMNIPFMLLVVTIIILHRFDHRSFLFIINNTIRRI